MTTPRNTTELLVAQANSMAVTESLLPGGPVISQGLIGIASALPLGALPLPTAAGALPGAGFPGPAIAPLALPALPAPFGNGVIARVVPVAPQRGLSGALQVAYARTGLG